MTMPWQRQTHLARPFSDLLRLGTAHLRPPGAKELTDPRRAERLLQLPVRECLGEVTEETDRRSQNALRPVLIGQSEMEEGEDVGDVREKDVPFAAGLEAANNTGIRLEDTFTQRVDVIDEVVIGLKNESFGQLYGAAKRE